jgi:hypothetical protein
MLLTPELPVDPPPDFRLGTAFLGGMEILSLTGPVTLRTREDPKTMNSGKDEEFL